MKDLKDLDLEKDSPPIQRSLGLSSNLKDDAFIYCVEVFHMILHRKCFHYSRIVGCYLMKPQVGTCQHLLSYFQQTALRRDSIIFVA